MVLEQKIGFDKVREKIAAKCATQYALRKVEAEQISRDPGEIMFRLRLTDEMRLICLFEDSFPAGGYLDTKAFLLPLQAENTTIDLPSLRALRTSLDTLRRILAFFRDCKDDLYPTLRQISASVTYEPEIGRRIETILDRAGEVRDTASQALGEIRRTLRSKEGQVSRRINAILGAAKGEGLVDTDAEVVVRDGRVLIPVPAGAKKKLPGIVYDESASGKTAFVEPLEIIELGNQIRELQFDEQREIARILFEFTEFLRPYLGGLIAASEYIGEIDFIRSKALVALDMIAGMPILSEGGELNLRRARHPLLEASLRREKKEIVPLTLSLTRDKHILLISGPNAGGKSVCLKTVGLLQYMFQWGMLIPTSEVSEMMIFDSIFIDIGDDQSLENDLSTYSSFLSDMREMLSEADERTLVLIDEFGAGTEPAAGGAIAEAILAEIDRRGVWGVITTHYTNLKLYAAGAETRVINGAMLYDSSKIAPMFALEIGLPGNSFAFELARKMRLPESIVKDAEARAGEEFVGIERNLRKIARGRRQIDERLQKIKHTDKTLEGLTEQYQQELEDIRRQRKDILEEARKEAEQIVKGAGAQVEKTIRVIKESQADKEQTKVARAELQGFIGALQNHKTRQQKQRDEYLDRKITNLEKRRKKADSAPAEPKTRTEPLKVGEKVRVRSNGLVGEVTRVSGKNVTISVGNISSTMKADTLERISSTEFREISRKVFKPALQKVDASISSRKLNFSPEIDIRGAHLADALDIVTHFIDDAIMLSVGQVRIIHGKGTGVLHEEIQKYLRTIPGVGKVSDEDVRTGGSGVTIVTLE